MSMLNPTVLIADDHPLVAEALHRLLEKDFEVLGAVGTGEDLLDRFRETRPDVVLLDAVLPRQDGFMVARQLKTLAFDVRIIFVTMLTEPIYISKAFQIGAKGYVLKHAAASDLLQAIRAALRNERYISPEIIGNVREVLEYPWMKPEGFTARLTERQREILQLVSRGDSVHGIAETLNISAKTVRYHKTCIHKKLGVQSASSLTKFALLYGLTSLTSTKHTGGGTSQPTDATIGKKCDAIESCPIIGTM